MPHNMMLDSAIKYQPTYYEVLNLPWRAHAGANLSPQYLKAAYRRALLEHHPDKRQALKNSQYPQAGAEVTSRKLGFTVDEITEAFSVLSVPKLRSEYDRMLKIQSYPEGHPGQGEKDKFCKNFETLDLDELAYDENEEIWFKGCRCGEQRGFVIREGDLEGASDAGELLVGCGGCSLWLRILFGTVEDDQNGQPTEHG